MEKNNEKIYTVTSHFGVAISVIDQDRSETVFSIPKKSQFAVGDQLRIEKGRLKQLPRKNELARQTPFSSRQVMAANIDALGIVISAHPKTPLQFIDGCIVAAFSSGILPFIIVNKMDLELSQAFSEEITKTYGEALSVFPASCYHEQSLQALQNYMSLQGRVIFVGVSGAGKSSLTNALIPSAQRQIGAAISLGGQGTHTTSASRLLKLALGGELIDTPGVRDFTPVQLKRQDIAYYFPHFKELLLIQYCRFRDCLHVNEPGCCIKEAVAEGKISQERYADYLQLLGRFE